MTISVSCPSCGKVLQAKESAAGKKAKCPDCGEVIKIPELDALMDAEEIDDDFGGMDLADEEADMPATASRKPCPACGEMIVKGAAKCRYCGEILDPALKKMEKKRKRAAGGGSADDEMTGSDWVICILCPGIGCIGGIIYLIQGKPKAGKILGISILMAVIYNMISFALQMAAQNG